MGLFDEIINLSIILAFYTSNTYYGFIYKKTNTQPYQ